jgi:hypothetical protein
MKIANDTFTIKTEMTQQEYDLQFGRILAIAHNSTSNDWIEREYKRLVTLKRFIKQVNKK